MPKPSLYVPGNLRPTCPEQTNLDTEIPLKYILRHIENKQNASLEGSPSINNRLLMLKAETGSGKTTALVYELYKWASKTRNIIVTQPRVLTAIDKANELGRKSEFYPGMESGQNVGYSTGPDKDPAILGILYATIGTLLMKLKLFPAAEIMKQYSYILIDEAHERSGLELDLTLYYLKIFLENNYAAPNCPFVIIMSATIELPKYTNFFGVGAEDSIHVVGYSNKITEHWLDISSSDIAASCVSLVGKLNENPDPPDKCDILIFVPGEAETKKIASGIVAANIPQVAVVILNRTVVNSGGADFDNITKLTLEELSARHKKQYRRRVIVSTVVAETGITIETLKYCIDCGWSRTTSYIPTYDLNVLLTRPASASAIRQRKGRVGRMFDGEFYPMYTKETYDKIPQYEDPAIYNKDLTMMMVGLYCGRPQKDEEEPQLHPPLLLDTLPTEAVRTAIRKLDYLGLLFTPLMPIVNNLSLDSAEAAKMLLSGYAWKVSFEDLATIAAFAKVQRNEYLITRPPKEKDSKVRVFDVRELAEDMFGQCWGIATLFADGFLEPLLIERFFRSLVKRESLDVVYAEMEKRGIKPIQFAEGLAARDSLVEELKNIGLHETWPSFEFVNDLRQVVDFVTRCKRCIYEGYKMNLGVEVDGVYRDRYGNKLNVSAFTGMRAKSKRFLFPELTAKLDTQSGLHYAITIDKICPLDGFF
jgi:HrpA-like RNA helicase